MWAWIVDIDAHDPGYNSRGFQWFIHCKCLQCSRVGSWHLAESAPRRSQPSYDFVSCIMYNASIYDCLLPSNATLKPCEFAFFNPHLCHRSKKNNTLTTTTCPVPLICQSCWGSGPNCSTAVMFLDMDVSWCVSSGNGCRGGNLINFWLVEHKIWPRHSSWYMLCTICIHNSHAGTQPLWQNHIGCKDIKSKVQCLKQSLIFKFLTLSNKQILSSSWIFIFASTGSHLDCPESAPCRIPGLQVIRRSTAKEDAISLWQP